MEKWNNESNIAGVSLSNKIKMQANVMLDSLKKKLGTLQLRTVKMKHEPLLTSFWEFIGRI